MTHLGSYQIIRKLARGGMAELFLARTLGKQSFEKIVALKQILPKYAESQRYVNLFLDEARLAANLNHANIVQVYDIGMEAGNYFFAMEYIHGQDVRTILHRAWRDAEKLPIKFAVQIAMQVGAALHYAHEKRRPDGQIMGIVHRDVSPSNVLVSYDGAVKLVDFGVAKAATSTNKTRTGTLKGKIAYMSPEQARGMPLDRRSDVFSLGIVLWEMVTTQRLFRGENDLQTLQLIINEKPKRPTEFQPACSEELERIIMKALAQTIDERYQTADELVADLEKLEAAEQLGNSSAALGAYMSGLFTPELNAWHQSQAQGMDLGEHLTQVGELTTPVSESEFIEPLDFDELDVLEEEEDEVVDGDDAPTMVPPTRPAPALGHEAPTMPLLKDPSGLVGAPRPTPPPRPAAPPPRPTPPSVARTMTPNRPEVTPPPSAFPVAPGVQPYAVVPTHSNRTTSPSQVAVQAAAAGAAPRLSQRISARMQTFAALYDEAPEVDQKVAVRIERGGVVAVLIVFGFIVLLSIVLAIAT